MPSGGVEPGEESSEAAIREVEEEVSNVRTRAFFFYTQACTTKQKGSFRKLVTDAYLCFVCLFFFHVCVSCICRLEFGAN